MQARANSWSVSPSRRFEILKRDGFKCQYCGLAAPDAVLEVDHVVPVSKGGGNEASNLIAACYDCNRGKRGRPLSTNIETSDIFKIYEPKNVAGSSGRGGARDGAGAKLKDPDGVAKMASFRMGPSILAQIRQGAERLGISQSELISRGVTMYLASLDNQSH